MDYTDRKKTMIRRLFRFMASGYAALMISLLPLQAEAENSAASEYAVKAALVFKIAKFVTWPEQAFGGLSEPLSVCVHENNPLAPALSTLDGKPIHGRPFSVRYLGNDPVVSTDCQILLITQAAIKRQTTLLKSVSTEPVLTIIDSDQFRSKGGIIGLGVRQNRIQFEIDIAASESAGLEISAQLLELAKAMGNRQGT